MALPLQKKKTQTVVQSGDRRPCALKKNGAKNTEENFNPEEEFSIKIKNQALKNHI